MPRASRLALASALALAFALALIGGAAPVSAQGSAALNRFSAAPTPEDDFALSRPTDLGHLRFGAQLHADYAHEPLVFRHDDGTVSRIVGHQLGLDLALSLGLFDRLVLFGGLPVVALMEGDAAAALRTRGLVTPDGPGLGDAYVGARVRLFGEADDAFALGAQVAVTFPTAGGDQRFRGDGNVTLRPQLLAEIRPGAGARIVLDVGALVLRDAVDEGSNLAFSDALTFGLGFAIPLFEDADRRTHLDLHAQLSGATAFADFFGRDQTALEAIAGLKLFHASGVVAGLAAGPGLTQGIGTPTVRVIAMLGYALPAEQPAPIAEEPVDPCVQDPTATGCPDADADGDGIRDVDDACPSEPGPAENRGCPDADQDGDGIFDRLDGCPSEPEDRDGFEDDDGCPDLDDDRDGVPDASDACPREPGPATNRGCPDPDRDGDGVVDRLDNCPDEPGPAENQGCARRQQVRIEAGRLEILDVVHFQSNRAVIQSRSFTLLANVAAVLNAHPEITHVRVEGHTDARGRRDRNMILSQQRAEAVVRFLVERGGVDPARLVAQGYGPDRPVVPDARSAEDHARNRRVEFHIVSGSGVEAEARTESDR